jgi:hypothetical protein
MARRGKPDRGVIVAEDETGARFVASSEDPETTAALRSRDPINRRALTTMREDRLTFTLDAD